MTCSDFVKATILKMSSKTFNEFKDFLVNRKLLDFHTTPQKEISRFSLSEKVCDYYDKLYWYSIKSSDFIAKDFDKMLKEYFGDLDSLVDNRIAESPNSEKNTKEAQMPRARKYYEKARLIRKAKGITTIQLIEYTRIIMCLYAAIIDNGLNVIDDFDFSPKCIQPQKILSSMDQEKKQLMRFSFSHRFDTSSWNSPARSTYILLIICLFSIIDKTIQGEYYNA